jgi:hypothetical protein
VANISAERDVIDIIAVEMANGVDAAVECWMAEFDAVLQDSRLTTLGRLQAIQEIMAQYRFSTGKGDRCTQGRKREN